MTWIEPVPLAVAVDGRNVPATIWTVPDRTAPLVLLGHGGSGHKTSARQQELANRLVDAGLAAMAIDGPAHGERASESPLSGGYPADLVARGMTTVVRDMVNDWIGAINSARAWGAVNQQLGYLGLSMGTRFGLPLAAALGDRLHCAVFGKFGLTQSHALNPGLHDATRLRRAARGVTSPILWHIQWDDELFPRAGQLDMFDALGCSNKQILAFPGPHGLTTDAAKDAWRAFLARQLLPSAGRKQLRRQ